MDTKSVCMGNMLNDDLLDVWANSKVIKEVRDRYVIPMSELPECSNCEWVDYCNGGCPGIVQQIQKTIMAPNWRGCYRNFLKSNGIKSIHDAADRRGEPE